MTKLRFAATATLLLASACAPLTLEEEVIIVEPVVEEPTYNDFDEPGAKAPLDCTEAQVTGDGIGGTGCPAID